MLTALGSNIMKMRYFACFRFVVLSPASSDQVTLLNLTAADKKLEELPVYKDLLQLFITQEVGISECCGRFVHPQFGNPSTE